ncbi:hypothetical protein Gotri_011883 [Gossypium trilobum]|uniref:Uncharacterized protein n=1 Tax=Gossypium trilobum TaxID=34281 RepID=A0A7J9EVP6_9ROSI|nr:hypothetical protein [Gossypium trilobum]
MTKGVDEPFEPTKTHGGGKKVRKSRDMLSTLNNRIAKLEGFMGNVRETFEEVEGCTVEKESRQDQLKGQVTEVLSANVIAMLVVLNTIVDNTTMGKLTEKDDALET